MDPLYLVDGSGYIFRAFYAVAPLSNANGLPTNAILGFTRMLMKLLSDVKARHVAVAFDRPEPTFRHQMYSEYKANRKECPAELVLQMPYFRKVVNALGLSYLEQAGVEADDILATITKLWQSPEQQVVIVSGDKDLTQLVNDRVLVWDAMRDIRYDEAKVIDKFGVPPTLIADYLALIGDTSDNVPGIKGIGPKTAVALIQAFGGIDAIIEVITNNPQKIEEVKGLRGATSIRQKLESSLDQLRLSYRLVELTVDVKDIHGLSHVDELLWHGVNLDLAKPLFEELEFSSILSALSGGKLAVGSNITVVQSNTVQSNTMHSNTVYSNTVPTTTNRYPGKSFQLITQDELPGLLAELRQHQVFAFDTETTGLDPKTCELVGISFSVAEGRAFYLPVENIEVIRPQISPIFADASVKKCGLNLKFDLGVLEEQGIPVAGISFDAMIASHVINSDRRQHGLKALAQQHLGETMLSYEEMLGEAENIRQVDPERLASYACHDAEASWRLVQILESRLGERKNTVDGAERASLRRVFEDIEMPLVPILSAMERTGIAIDTDFLQQLDAEFVSDIERLEQRIFELAGTEFNLNSPKQLAEILFEKLALPTTGVKRTQSTFSTDASVLAKFVEEYEIARQLLEYRELHKLKSTYVDSLLRLQHPKTGRIHTSFNQAVAATGRLSSSEPNLQNIPIRNPRGRKIRQAFVAQAGCRLISADYSQIELRILAHLSADTNLIAAFNAGEDIHLRTARELFGEFALAGDSQGDLRRVAKTINFGVIYGIGAFRLARELGISRKQAQEHIDSYFARYPKVAQYFERSSKEIAERGYVETMFGRRRYHAEIDTSGRDAGYAERSLLNAAIQGSAAEIIKIAMIHLQKRLAEFPGVARMVLQVHDELVVEVEESSADAVLECVRSTMESAVQISVPLSVDVGAGRSWGDAL